LKTKPIRAFSSGRSAGRRPHLRTGPEAVSGQGSESPQAVEWGRPPRPGGARGVWWEWNMKKLLPAAHSSVSSDAGGLQQHRRLGRHWPDRAHPRRHRGGSHQGTAAQTRGPGSRTRKLGFSGQLTSGARSPSRGRWHWVAHREAAVLATARQPLGQAADTGRKLFWAKAFRSRESAPDCDWARCDCVLSMPVGVFATKRKRGG